MSISQHIAGIKSRSGSNRAVSTDGVEDEPQASEVNQEEPTRSVSENELVRKMCQVEIESVPDGEGLDASNQSDINKKLEKLKHMEILYALQLQWHQIDLNLEDTLDHLQGYSHEVNESSAACLDALKNSVEITCDKVDEKLQAFYHLMTKCEELNTKLSAAGSFREEIKTLRKSVETLEQFFYTV